MQSLEINYCLHKHCGNFEMILAGSGWALDLISGEAHQASSLLALYCNEKNNRRSPTGH